MLKSLVKEFYSIKDRIYFLWSYLLTIFEGQPLLLQLHYHRMGIAITPQGALMPFYLLSSVYLRESTVGEIYAFKKSLIYNKGSGGNVNYHFCK